MDKNINYNNDEKKEKKLKNFIDTKFNKEEKHGKYDVILVDKKNFWQCGPVKSLSKIPLHLKQFGQKPFKCMQITDLDDGCIYYSDNQKTIEEFFLMIGEEE